MRNTAHGGKQLYWNQVLEIRRRQCEVCTVPVVDGGPSQHHRIIVGPFRCVAPTLLVAVPEVAASGVTYDSLWKALPDSEGKVHLDRQEYRF